MTCPAFRALLTVADHALDVLAFLVHPVAGWNAAADELYARATRPRDGAERLADKEAGEEVSEPTINSELKVGAPRPCPNNPGCDNSYEKCIGFCWTWAHAGEVDAEIVDEDDDLCPDCVAWREEAPIDSEAFCGATRGPQDCQLPAGHEVHQFGPARPTESSPVDVEADDLADRRVKRFKELCAQRRRAGLSVTPCELWDCSAGEHSVECPLWLEDVLSQLQPSSVAPVYSPTDDAADGPRRAAPNDGAGHQTSQRK